MCSSEWNNGTIFRVYVKSFNSSIINAKVDISQQDLSNKVFIGVENFILTPLIDTLEYEQYWRDTSYLQLQSLNLPPYIDYSFIEFDEAKSGNTRIFARLPLIAIPTIHSSPGTTYTKFGLDRVLNKDSILCEMINNPNALSNGNLTIRLLDQDGVEILGDAVFEISLTLVIYKPSNKYS
jgi:hypothetical protein